MYMKSGFYVHISLLMYMKRGFYVHIGLLMYMKWGFYVHIPSSYASTNFLNSAKAVSISFCRASIRAIMTSGASYSTASRSTSW